MRTNKLYYNILIKDEDTRNIQKICCGISRKHLFFPAVWNAILDNIFKNDDLGTIRTLSKHHINHCMVIYFGINIMYFGSLLTRACELSATEIFCWIYDVIFAEKIDDKLLDKVVLKATKNGSTKILQFLFERGYVNSNMIKYILKTDNEKSFEFMLGWIENNQIHVNYEKINICNYKIFAEFLKKNMHIAKYSPQNIIKSCIEIRDFKNAMHFFKFENYTNINDLVQYMDTYEMSMLIIDDVKSKKNYELARKLTIYTVERLLHCFNQKMDIHNYIFWKKLIMNDLYSLIDILEYLISENREKCVPNTRAYKTPTEHMAMLVDDIFGFAIKIADFELIQKMVDSDFLYHDNIVKVHAQNLFKDSRFMNIVTQLIINTHYVNRIEIHNVICAHIDYIKLIYQNNIYGLWFVWNILDNDICYFCYINGFVEWVFTENILPVELFAERLFIKTCTGVFRLRDFLFVGSNVDEKEISINYLKILKFLYGTGHVKNPQNAFFEMIKAYDGISSHSYYDKYVMEVIKWMCDSGISGNIVELCQYDLLYQSGRSFELLVKNDLIGKDDIEKIYEICRIYGKEFLEMLRETGRKIM